MYQSPEVATLLQCFTLLTLKVKGHVNLTSINLILYNKYVEGNQSTSKSCPPGVKIRQMYCLTINLVTSHVEVQESVTVVYSLVHFICKSSKKHTKSLLQGNYNYDLDLNENSQNCP